MTKSIMLDGGKEIKLAANAATPFRYKQLFGADLLKLFQRSTTSEEEGMALADVIAQLAFIMNRQAEGADMNTLSVDEFFTWLEGFEAMDLVNVGQEILDVYISTTKTSVEAKKK